MTAQCTHRSSRGARCRLSASWADVCTKHLGDVVTVEPPPSADDPNAMRLYEGKQPIAPFETVDEAIARGRRLAIECPSARDWWTKFADRLEAERGAVTSGNSPGIPGGSIDGVPADANSSRTSNGSLDDVPAIVAPGPSAHERAVAAYASYVEEGERDASPQNVPARLALSERGVELYEADWRSLAAIDPVGVDTMIVDAPYSEVTHAGHDSGAASANRPIKANVDTGRARRSIAYRPWTPADVQAFVEVWSPLVRGWFVTITDDVLAPAWRASLAAAGRLAFAPIPLVETGATVRLTGDGPSSWTTWIVVARPRNREFSSWGTLGGAYIVPSESKPVVGGKPLSAIRALVRDYSRPGDLVVDPCCGGGTLGVACIAEGRRALLGDIDASHVAIAAERLRSLPAADRRGTLSLFGRVGS